LLFENEVPSQGRGSGEAAHVGVGRTAIRTTRTLDRLARSIWSHEVAASRRPRTEARALRRDGWWGTWHQSPITEAPFIRRHITIEPDAETTRGDRASRKAN